jgi:CHASE3 domain sensor protein
MRNEEPEHVTTTEARQGATPHMTRYVLGVGLALIVVVFAIILMIAFR